MRPVRAILVVLLVLSCGLSAVYAQRRGLQRMETLRTEATIKGITPRLLQVVTADGGEWFVTVPGNPEHVVFQGSAEPAWLQVGMWVRFNAILTTDKRRKEYSAQQPVGELAVITVRPGIEPGIFPDNTNVGRDAVFNREVEDEKEVGKDREREKEGKKEREQEKEGEKERGRDRQKERDTETPRKSRARGDVQEARCLVIGRLIEFKDNKMRVAVGRIPVVAELSATAEVSIDMNEVTFVRIGDKVDVNARFVPSQPGRAEGQELTVTAAKPLTAEDWPSKGKRRTARSRKPDDGETEKQERDKGKNKDKDTDDGLR